MSVQIKDSMLLVLLFFFIMARQIRNDDIRVGHITILLNNILNFTVEAH